MSLITNYLRVISLVLLLSIFGLSNAQTSNQKVTIELKNVTLKDFIRQIESQTNYTIVYQDTLIDNKKDITIKVVEEPLNKVINTVLDKEGLQATFKNNTIVITKKNTDSSREKKSVLVSGVVYDEEGMPVIGASITIPGTNRGVITDLDGRFSIEAPLNSTLKITYVGYQPKEIIVTDNPNVKIILQQAVKELEEIVITAQAIGQKNAILKQINSNTLKNVISAEKLQQNPDINTIEAIGRLPGISVIRSGGEGAAFLIRGLDQTYSKVLINGEPLAVGLNAVSPYSLEGVEVYKTLTANQEGDAVAGSVDLTMREAPKGLHYSIMAQSGYNALNKDFGNYSFVGMVSNRFFNEKLGFFLSLTADRVNRSTNLLNVGYNTNYTTNLNDPFYINGMNFTLNERINYKQSAVLTLDYIVNKSTTLNFQSFLSTINYYSSSQSKSFNPEGGIATIPIYVNMSKIPKNRTSGITNNFSGRTTLKFLRSILYYGVSYVYNETDNPGTRTWAYSSKTRADGLSRDSLKVFSPEQVASHFDKILGNLKETELESMSYDQTYAKNWSLTPRIDFEIPIKSNSDLVHGKIQLGAKYRLSHNYFDRNVGIAAVGNNSVFIDFIKNNYNYYWPSGIVELTVAGQENNFLGGSYNFGDKYSFERNDLVFDAWLQHGKETYLAGPTGGLSDDPRYSGFVYDLYSSAMNDLDDINQYGAGYIMPEINIGKWLMIMPGVRFEYGRTKMKAYSGNEVTRPYSVFQDINSAYSLKDSIAIREDKFFLPMLHLRIKPIDWFYTHFSYTHTLRRPDLSMISPFEYYNAQDASSYSYSAGNPNLKTELWKSYDLQLTFHGRKAGLFSITGFKKTVKDKLWSRTYKRIQGEPIPNPVFKDNDLVNMTVYENHPYSILLEGIETEWQTSFGYLPKPFSYLTLSANYTYTHGKSPNPYTRLYKYKPEGSRYELTGRKDSVVIEPMTGVPEHVFNLTMGIEVKNFKSYLSYQYSSEKILQTHPNDLRLYVISEPYSRLDFNASYGFDFKNKDILEIILRTANLTNSEDRVRYRGEHRPISVEQYGITVDLGLRYKF